MISSSIESENKLKDFFENKLLSLNLPELIHIDTNTLDTDYLNSLYINNSALKEIMFENLEQSPFILLGDSIKSINLNSLKRIESKNISNNNLFSSNLLYKFLCNTKIEKLELPNFEGVTNIINQPDYGNNSSQNTNASFVNNYWLKEVTLGNNKIAETNTHFNGYWFANCYSLKYLKLLYPFVIPLSSNVGFQTNPIGAGEGKIYVPDNLVNDYKNATYWATYNTKIFPLSQFEIDKEQEKEITDSWENIIGYCNDGTAASRYEVGDCKTIEINGIPIQMVIVNTANAGNNSSNRDMLASNLTQPVQLTWMEKTILDFNRYNITSSYPFSYDNSTSFQEIMNNIFEGIPEGHILRSENGIKTVQKSYFGFDEGSQASSSRTGNFKIWAPSAAELGYRQNQTNLTYDYFKNADLTINRPNYRLGNTNIYIIDEYSNKINVALRDFDNINNARPSTIQSELAADGGFHNTNPGINPYVIFGFCT